MTPRQHLVSSFLLPIGERPLLVTVTETVNDDDHHLDVSLWFVLRGERDQPLAPDSREFRGVHWWTPAEIRTADPALFDPHMVRMLDKLATARV